MTNNPLAAIEFFAFIGFVLWLFFWQQGGPRRTRGETPARHDEQAESNE